MALVANASMKFDSYRAVDSGIVLTFLCAAPGAGENSYYEVLITDVELTAIATAVDFRNLVLSKLLRKFRVLSKLDALVGQSVTI